MAWKLYSDGGSRGNPGPGASGVLIFDENDKLLTFTGKFFPVTTNNNAEYDGLYQGLLIAAKYLKKSGETNVELDCYLDSELAVKQMNGIYKISDANLKSIKAKIDTILPSFAKVTFNHVPRELNKLADKMVNLILDTKLEQ